MSPLRYPAALVVGLALSSSLALAEDRPLSGKKVPGFEPVDKAVLEFMDTVDCQAATVAVSRDGRLLYSRGYGWADEEKKKPVPADALMRIASATKPVTAAAVRNAIRAKHLSLDTKAFDFIGVKPPGGKAADPRIKKITVGQLLDHKGGWDRDAAFDPMFRTAEIEKTLGLTKPATPVNVIEYMLTQPLQFDPGAKSVYSNFGYCVLGRVLEKAMKKPYADCIQQSVCKPAGIKDMKLGSGEPTKRDPREVWYPVREGAFSLDVMDAHGGLIASAPAVCQFMQAYWISGEPRQRGQRGGGTFFGSLPGTTAMAHQREDGYNVAVLLNGRRDKQFNEDNESLKEAIDRAVERIGKGK
jgi:CubicO group peptidase (beta-lactamase class C family)